MSGIGTGVSAKRPRVLSRRGRGPSRAFGRPRHAGSGLDRSFLPDLAVIWGFCLLPRPQYDLSATTYSPDGKVFQTEYAQKAVDNGR